MDVESDILRATLPINSTVLIVRFLRGPTPLLRGWPVVARLTGTRDPDALRAVDDLRAVAGLRAVEGLRAEDDLRFADFVVSFALDLDIFHSPPVNISLTEPEARPQGKVSSWNTSVSH